MSATLAEFLEELDDPSQYVRLPERAVFDEHTDVRHVDPRTGKPVPPGRNAKKVVQNFDRATLERIARNCNRRARLGDLCPLTLGHTDPDEPSEKAQPEIVGYARNFSVKWDSQRGKWMLHTDYYIRKDRYQEANGYPRSSIELWPTPGQEIIDPIALLRRTPQRDLGQWVYRRRGGQSVLRYSMEYAMPPAPPSVPMDDLPLQHGADMAPEGEEIPHGERLEQFMRHCFSHPHARHFARHYSADSEPPPEMADPTGPPQADLPLEAPQQNAYASSTNAALPGKQQYRRDQESLRFARMERELAETRRKMAVSEARRIVTQLDAEGIILDASVEVPAFAALDDQGRDARTAHIRRYYRRAPIGHDARVAIDDTPLTSEAAYDPEDPESLSPRDQEQVYQYQRQNNLWDFDLAVRKVFPERFKK